MYAEPPNTAYESPLGLRIYNRVRGFLTACGVPEVKLDEESLHNLARRRTGLDDFGDDFYREPFQRLLNAYQQESQLTEFGRFFTRINFRILLSNRLQIQQVLKAHPEILNERLQHPFVIAGLPRTGTTLLYNLLAQDPENRPLLLWEAMRPAPDLREKKKGEEDPRIKQTKRIVRVLNRLAPKLKSIHPLHATGPEECNRLLQNTFITPINVMENYIPSYTDWYLNLPVERLEVAYQDYYRQLQILQWQNPSQGQWLLKSPTHLFALEPLRRTMPDVRLIQTHRDPHKMLPSSCSLFATYQNISSDRVDLRKVGEEVMKLMRAASERSLEMHRSEHRDQTFHVQYKELMADPVKVLHQIYEYFGGQLSPVAEAGAKRWLAENPANKHGVHRYSLEEFGLTSEQMDSTFAEYSETFKVPREKSPAA